MSNPELPDVEVLDVFELDERGRLVTVDPSRRPAPPARPPKPAHATRTEPDPPRRAPAGPPQSTPPPPRSAPRLFGRRDVRCAAFVDPVDAAQRLVNDRVLHQVDGIEVGPGPPSIDGSTISWSVTIRRRRWNRWRRAELCVHPSPSWVMTMIELRPVDRRRFGGGFVRAGLPVVVELSDRLVATPRPEMAPA